MRRMVVNLYRQIVLPLHRTVAMRTEKLWKPVPDWEASTVTLFEMGGYTFALKWIGTSGAGPFFKRRTW